MTSILSSVNGKKLFQRRDVLLSVLYLTLTFRYFPCIVTLTFMYTAKINMIFFALVPLLLSHSTNLLYINLTYNSAMPCVFLAIVCNETPIQNSSTRFINGTSYVGTVIEVECLAGHYLQQGVFSLQATCNSNAYWVSATNIVLDALVSCKRK